ncbi:MAG: glycosyltransferase [Betaproteobacteria bacterium]|nr:glycosyltransferase [Betaproteobacteria bacterium]
MDRAGGGTQPRRAPRKARTPAAGNEPLPTNPQIGPTVLFVSPELPPWIKAGGLGDVTAALPPALRVAGVNVRVLIPAYPTLLAGREARSVAEYPAPGGVFPAARVLALGEVNGVPLYAVDCPPLFDREGGAYQDANGHDWADMHLRFGLFGKIAANIAQWGLADGFRPTIVHCHDWISGLVPAYLRWAGVTDVRTIMTVHNMAHQGIFPGSVLPALDIPLDAFQLNGVEYYGNHPQRIAARIGFEERLAHWIEAGADMFAMPSRFEPCGLNQLYSLRYSNPPIVRATGGLADTVTDYDDATGDATGFVFQEATGAALFDAIRRAVAVWRDRDAWRALQRNGMRRDSSWEASARQYVRLYQELTAGLGATG